MPDEKMYTLEQARQLILRRDCELRGSHRLTRLGTENITTKPRMVWACEDCRTPFVELGAS